MRGREVSVGRVYAALGWLELRGGVESRLGESASVRGDRTKQYFRVTEQGLGSVRVTRQVSGELWNGLPYLGEELA